MSRNLQITEKPNKFPGKLQASTLRDVAHKTGKSRNSAENIIVMARGDNCTAQTLLLLVFPAASKSPMLSSMLHCHKPGFLLSIWSNRFCSLAGVKKTEFKTVKYKVFDWLKLYISYQDA